MRPEQLFTHLLRILTPEEILELTTISRGEAKQKLTLLVSNRMAETDFSNETYFEYQELSKPKEDENEEEEGKENNVVDIQEAVTRFSEEESKIERVSSVPTEKKGATFFIDIKKRTKKSRETLKQKEILSLYESNAAIDIEQEKACKEDLNKSVFKGVLVNKKQS